MKLLLTSAGIRNKRIADALSSLLPKPIHESKVGFIPTAANVEAGNKDWFIEEFMHLPMSGFRWIDVVDISAADVEWKDRLAEVDLVVVSGGNTFHVLNQVRKSGFGEWLKENSNQKVYVGISAGSIIVTPNIAVASVDDGDVNLSGLTDFTGLGLVDFEVSPHTPENVIHDANRHYAKTISNVLYEIDNETAIKVLDQSVELITERQWIKY